MSYCFWGVISDRTKSAPAANAVQVPGWPVDLYDLSYSSAFCFIVKSVGIITHTPALLEGEDCSKRSQSSVNKKSGSRSIIGGTVNLQSLPPDLHSLLIHSRHLAINSSLLKVDFTNDIFIVFGYRKPAVDYPLLPELFYRVSWGGGFAFTIILQWASFWCFIFIL